MPARHSITLSQIDKCQRTIINFKVDLTEKIEFFNNIVICWVEAKTVTEIKFSAMMVPTSFFIQNVSQFTLK